MVKVKGTSVSYNDDMDGGEYWELNFRGEYSNPVTILIWEEDG